MTRAPFLGQISLVGRPIQRSWMGAGAEGLAHLDESDRDVLLRMLKLGLDKARAISAIVDWSHGRDPWLKNFFGEDQGAFWMVWSAIAPYQPAVEGVYKRLSEADPDFWIEPSDSEQDAIDAWLPGVGSAFQLYQAHMEMLPPGQRPGAMVPAARTPVAPPVIPVAPAAAAGPTTTEYLVAGAVVLALGAAVYTLL